MLSCKNKLVKPISALALVLAFSRVALAGSDCKVKTYFEWGCDKGDNPMMGTVATILGWLAAGLSIVVLMAIVYGAIIYLTAGADKSKVENGKKIIRNAIIALIGYFFMYSLLNFLVPGGIFGWKR